MQAKTECWEKLEKLYNRFVVEFSEKQAEKIFNIIMSELGTDRITISLAYYHRKIRDQRIRAQFTGDNYEELGIIHDLSIKHIRYIVHNTE